jgi:hypothetical protein
MTLRLIKVVLFVGAVLYLLLPLSAEWNSYLVTGLVLWMTPIFIVWLHWPSSDRNLSLAPIRNEVYRGIMRDQERSNPARQVVIAFWCALFVFFLSVLFAIGHLEYWPAQMQEVSRHFISSVSRLLPSLDHLATALTRAHERCDTEFGDPDILVRQLTIVAALLTGLAMLGLHAAFYFAMRKDERRDALVNIRWWWLLGSTAFCSFLVHQAVWAWPDTTWSTGPTRFLNYFNLYCNGRDHLAPALAAIWAVGCVVLFAFPIVFSFLSLIDRKQ